MGAIGVVLVVAFVIICVLSILLVLVQEPDNSGMGGMLGGGNSAAFGSHSASVLTKITIAFVIIFFLLTFLFALLNIGGRRTGGNDLSDVAAENGIVSNSSDSASSLDWWKKAEPAAPVQEEVVPEPVAEPEKTDLIMNQSSEAVVNE